MIRPGATPEDMAEHFGMDPDDIRCYVASFVDLPDDDIPYEILDDLHQAFNPMCARTVPAYHGQGGDDI